MYPKQIQEHDIRSRDPDEDIQNRDLALLNQAAERLNAEAEDALSYQVPVW
jgi:hypothetical protein